MSRKMFRIMVIGGTGSGKSTLINALVGKIILPESPMTSTAVPTFIEYTGNEEPYVQIIRKDHSILETLDTDSFIRKYCFNVEEQMETDRKRFQDVLRAVMHVKSNLLENNVRIVDSLGFEASARDTETTDSLLDGKRNLVLYVMDKNILKDVEIEKVQNLLGYRSKKQIAAGMDEITAKIDRSELYFVCNEKEQVITQGLANSVSRIFNSDDCGESEEDIRDFQDHHILKGNFLIGRIINCGIYPYRKYFPDDPTSEDYAFFDHVEMLQKSYAQLDVNDKRMITWKKLQKDVNRLVDQRINGRRQNRPVYQNRPRRQTVQSRKKKNGKNEDCRIHKENWSSAKKKLLTKMPELEDLYVGYSERKRAALHFQRDVLEMGDLHIALIGRPWSGKSTVANALSGRLVCPEKLWQRDTRISTYIVKPAVVRDMENVTLFLEDGTSETRTVDQNAFLNGECFYEDDSIKGLSSSRQDNICAVTHAAKEVFLKGTVLINIAETCETESGAIRIHTILNGIADFVVYVVSGSALTTGDIAFLQCNILGFHSNDPVIRAMDNEVRTPVVPPERLLILANGHYRGESVWNPLAVSTQRIFDADECAAMTQEEKDFFCEKNAWQADAFYGRLKNAGIWDYVKYAPVNYDDHQMQKAADMNQMQERNLQSIRKKDPYAVEQTKQWKRFQDNLFSLCYDSLKEDSEVLLTKYNGLLAGVEQRLNMRRE